MHFRCKWSNAIYIVRPSQRQLDQLGIVTIRPGLRARFDENHAFDSKQAQEEANWTDEEREAVERHLLKHKDYGNGLILMPGQEIPEDLQKIARVDRDKVAQLCTHVTFADGKVVQCENESVPGGGNKCDTHKERQSEIVRGMLTST